MVGGAGAGKALHAKSKVGGGVCGIRRPVLSSPHHGDKTRFGAAGDVPQQPGGVQKIGALFFGSRVPRGSGKKLAPVGLQLVGGQVRPGLKLEGQQVLQVRVHQQAVPGPVNVLAVKKIAGVGGGVLELHVGRPDGAPRVGQSPLEVVGPARLGVVPHLSLPQSPLDPGSPGPVKISPVDAQGSPEPATPSPRPPVFLSLRGRFGLQVPGTAELVVTPVVNPVLVVVVDKDEGGLQVGLVKHQGQVCPLATVPAETQLAGAGVHAAAGQTGLSVLVSGALPVPVSPQGQVLDHQTLLSLGHVEPRPLHPQPPSDGPLVSGGPPGPLARRRLTAVGLLLGGGAVQHVEGSRAHGHVCQTCEVEKKRVKHLRNYLCLLFSQKNGLLFCAFSFTSARSQTRRQTAAEAPAQRGAWRPAPDRRPPRGWLARGPEPAPPQAKPAGRQAAFSPPAERQKKSKQSSLSLFRELYLLEAG